MARTSCRAERGAWNRDGVGEEDNIAAALGRRGGAIYSTLLCAMCAYLKPERLDSNQNLDRIGFDCAPLDWTPYVTGSAINHRDSTALRRAFTTVCDNSGTLLVKESIVLNKNGVAAPYFYMPIISTYCYTR